MTPAQALVKLALLGISAEKLGEVLEILESVSGGPSSSKTSAEKYVDDRRAKDRERKKNKYIEKKAISSLSADSVDIIRGNSAENIVSGGTIGGTTLQTTDISGLEERKVEVGSAREAEIPDLPPALVRRPALKPPEKAPQRFEEFWATYPKRAGTNSRKEAAERYRRAVVRGVEEAAIIAGAARYAAFCDAEGNTGTQFVQQAVTWLNQEGWTNDYTPSRKRQSELMDAFDRVGEKLQRAGGHQRADGPGGEGHRPLRGYDPPF